MAYISCARCKHCAKHTLLPSEDVIWVCQAPQFFDALEEPELNQENTFIEAKAVRMLKRECGRAAKWFEPRE